MDRPFNIQDDDISLNVRPSSLICLVVSQLKTVPDSEFANVREFRLWLPYDHARQADIEHASFLVSTASFSLWYSVLLERHCKIYQ